MKKRGCRKDLLWIISTDLWYDIRMDCPWMVLSFKSGKNSIGESSLRREHLGVLKLLGGCASQIFRSL